MMKPNLNRRGCLVIALLIVLTIAAFLWLAGEAPPAEEPGKIPPPALKNEGLATP